MKARDIIEEAFRKGAARQFIMRQPRLRVGYGWMLHISSDDEQWRDIVPVEILPGNVPNTLDAAYHLGMAIDQALRKQGYDISKLMHTAHDPHEREAAKYWEPLMAAIQNAEVAGHLNGIAGPFHWYLYDEGPEEEPEPEAE